MILGELFVETGTLSLNAGREKRTLTVANTGDRPIQIGSHYHFYETNAALCFERDIATGGPRQPARGLDRFSKGDHHRRPPYPYG